MAFKEWTEASTTDLVPFTDKYIETYPDSVGSMHDVINVKLRPKGLVLECKVVAGWIWKSKALHTFVLEFIERWYKEKGGAPVLQIRLTSTNPYYTIGVEEERKACWGKGADSTYWHQGYMTADDNPALTSNPLPLPPLPPTPTSVVEVHESASPDIRDLIPVQTAPDLPLDEAASSLNGVSGRKTRKAKPPAS